MRAALYAAALHRERLLQSSAGQGRPERGPLSPHGVRSRLRRDRHLGQYRPPLQAFQPAPWRDLRADPRGPRLQDCVRAGLASSARHRLPVRVHQRPRLEVLRGHVAQGQILGQECRG